ncbi:SRPBCC family protein [Conexibacter sp. SYSU D00693]|uniref:SRPBCC family protein n=1 Tax=Conexibacter sp. SYSU D00693 TaxID=2812560 RepID=UPI00196B1FA3|nr:SRPBCC family protein [Conexibacter sp. SYSU D00693]
MLRYASAARADPAVAWSLIARPSRWPAWAPHLRGAWGLAGTDGWVREGARGAARLLGAVPVPARIVRVVDGTSWTWRVGGVEMDHRVEPAAPGEGGCVVAVTMSAPAPVELALRATYGPVVSLLVDHLARAAERESP